MAEKKSLVDYVVEIKAQYPVGSQEAFRMALDRQERDFENACLQDKILQGRADRLAFAAAVNVFVDGILSNLLDESVVDTKPTKVGVLENYQNMPSLPLDYDLNDESARKVAEAWNYLQEKGEPKSEAHLDFVRYFLPDVLPRICYVWNTDLKQDSTVKNLKRKLKVSRFNPSELIGAFSVSSLAVVLDTIEPTVPSAPESNFDFYRAYGRAKEELRDHRFESQRDLVVLWATAHHLSGSISSIERAYEVVRYDLETIGLRGAQSEQREATWASMGVTNKVADEQKLRRMHEFRKEAIEYVRAQLNRHRGFFSEYFAR